jgi:hypothetical protein
MRRALLVFAIASVWPAASANGQTLFSFECHPDAPLPLSAAASCDLTTSNGLGPAGFPTAATSAPCCGFPTSGVRYARLVANGPVFVPGGGPFPWPVPAAQAPSEVRVPIPAGSTTVSFDWEYYNAESFGSIFNDGFAVGVVAAGGAAVQPLVYADNQVPLGPCQNCVNFAPEVLPPGFQTFSGSLPPLTGCEYLSIVCWNGGDNSVPGIAYVDNVAFDGVGPACPPPCFVGPPTLGWSAPWGAGSILASLGGAPPNGTYFLAVTLSAGAYPGGWFYGVDVGFQELVTEVNIGPPFWGPTDACGAVLIGPYSGLPSGFQVFAVALGMPGPTLGTWTTTSPATAFTVP